MTSHTYVWRHISSRDVMIKTLKIIFFCYKSNIHLHKILTDFPTTTVKKGPLGFFIVEHKNVRQYKTEKRGFYVQTNSNILSANCTVIQMYGSLLFLLNFIMRVLEVFGGFWRFLEVWGDQKRPETKAPQFFDHSWLFNHILFVLFRSFCLRLKPKIEFAKNSFNDCI